MLLNYTCHFLSNEEGHLKQYRRQSKKPQGKKQNIEGSIKFFTCVAAEIYFFHCQPRIVTVWVELAYFFKRRPFVLFFLILVLLSWRVNVIADKISETRSNRINQDQKGSFNKNNNLVRTVADSVS